MGAKETLRELMFEFAEPGAIIDDDAVNVSYDQLAEQRLDGLFDAPAPDIKKELDHDPV